MRESVTTIVVTPEIDSQQSLFVPLVADGIVNRLGTGAVDNAENDVFIGVDAATVTVEPTLWRGGKSVCHQIRERVPAHMVVDQRSRPADAIPRPMTTAWQRLRARLTKR